MQLHAVEVERRRFTRVDANRACKVYDPRSRRYTAGHTIDLSAGGMRLDLDRAVPVAPGDELYVALASKARPAVLSRADFVTVRVVRVIDAGGEVAVTLSHPAEQIDPELALAA